MYYTQFGPHSISRFILGSNPFSGFSHQSVENDAAMRAYYSVEQIIADMHAAEALKINTVLARADQRILDSLRGYWQQGGKMQWFAQTCPELGTPVDSIERAASVGAKACHIHGGVMDNLLANDRLGEVPAWVKLIHERGMLAGVAGHTPDVFRWAEQHLDVDYYMCSYYNPIPRVKQAEHVHGFAEVYLEEDRQAMTTLIQSLSKPVIHYKVMAAGRNNPAEALDYVVQHMRPSDAVCVGVFTRDQKNMIQENVELFDKTIVQHKDRI